MAIDFKYKIKKRKALKVEELPPRQTPKIYFKSVADQRYHSYEKKETNRNCCICANDAVVLVYFQLNKCQRLEKYCSECLDKWVYLDESVPIIGK
jgi:hypothetical protein